MKILKERTFFRGPEIEMSPNEYMAYKLGHSNGIIDGAMITIIVLLLTELFVKII